MRSLIIILGGVALFLIFVFAARFISQGNRSVMANAALAFLPVWFAAAAYNMWVGIYHAGYSASEEAPILVFIFGVPAALAIYLWRRFSRL